MTAMNYRTALDAARLKWATHDRPTRENLAFKDGFDAGWNAMLAIIGQITSSRFGAADRGLHGELPDGVSRDYLTGSAVTCVSIAAELIPHARENLDCDWCGEEEND